MKAFHIFIALIILASTRCNVVAQSPGIDSLYIVPSDPTEADVVELVIHAILPNLPCHLDHDSIEIEFNENQIQVETAYWTGWGAAFCYSIDTIMLGLFTVGHYDLYTYYEHGNYLDSDSLSFFVGSPTNIAVKQQSDIELNLFPNPLESGVINITYTLETLLDVSLEIRDLTGKLVAQKFQGLQPPGEQKIEMDLKDLPKGMYFLRIRTGDYVHIEKLVIQ